MGCRRNSPCSCRRSQSKAGPAWRGSVLRTCSSTHMPTRTRQSLKAHVRLRRRHCSWHSRRRPCKIPVSYSTCRRSRIFRCGNTIRGSKLERLGTHNLKIDTTSTDVDVATTYAQPQTMGKARGIIELFSPQIESAVCCVKKASGSF